MVMYWWGLLSAEEYMSVAGDSAREAKKRQPRNNRWTNVS